MECFSKLCRCCWHGIALSPLLHTIALSPLLHRPLVQVHIQEHQKIKQEHQKHAMLHLWRRSWATACAVPACVMPALCLIWVGGRVRAIVSRACSRGQIAVLTLSRCRHLSGILGKKVLFPVVLPPLPRHALGLKTQNVFLS